jgi:membrane peptidoglycan carboxypeptidase
MNTVMDYVRDHLNSKTIQKVLSDYGIENISTSGIKIYTTINRDIQRASLIALRKNLSILETKLTGYDNAVIQKRYRELKIPSEGDIEEGEFLFGKVVSKGGIGDPRLEVRLPNGTIGIIDKDGLRAIANALAQFREGQWAEGGPKYIQELVNAIKPGDLVYVYIRKYRMEKGEILLDLEQFPIVNGGVIVLQKGEIKGMVGGFTNFYFNRAIDAKRQVGSVFKPIVYLAALQLGWNNLDLLLNRKNVFTFGKQIYIPKPDHESPYDKVSMAWAGVKSENVATVWLLYHLCDRLTMSQFRDLANQMGMGRAASESYEEYVRKIRDRFGILIDDEALMKMAFEEAKNEISPDLIFEGKIKEAEALEYLKYGEGFAQYISRKKEEERNLPDEEKENLEPLLWNYLRLNEINRSLKNDYRNMVDFVIKGKGIWPKGFFKKSVDGKERIVYIPYLERGDLIPISPEEIKRKIAERGGEDIRKVFPLDQIWVDDKLPSGIIDALSSTIPRKLEELKKYQPYDFEILSRNRDFRVLVGLRYVVMLSKALGIKSNLDPVLSFPLGANSITLLDAARAYMSISGLKVYRNMGVNDGDAPIIISKIVSPEGDIIYEASKKEIPIIDQRPSYLVVDILKNVILHGTGSGAREKIVLSSTDEKKASLLRDLGIKVTAYGKTGTSNDYRNSSFVGFVPGFDQKEQALKLEDSYVIAAYVGYDDNRPMKNKRIKIFGASGALPVWIEVAKAVVSSSLYQKGMDPIDLSFQLYKTLDAYPPKDAVPVMVDRESGIYRGMASSQFMEDGVAKVYSFGKEKGNKFVPERWFLPITAGASREGEIKSEDKETS